MTALELAKKFADQAVGESRSKQWADGAMVWLTKKQADWLADLLRGEGQAIRSRPGFGMVDVERFMPIQDGTFWAQLNSERSAHGAAQLHFRRFPSPQA